MVDDRDPLEMVLQIFTKDELWNIGSYEKNGVISKSSSKQHILTHLLTNCNFQQILDFDKVIVQERQEDVALIKLMFFGHPYGDLSEFVARDVGHLRLQNRDDANFTPYFSTREELDGYWSIYLLYQEWKLALEVGTSPESALAWLASYIGVLEKWAHVASQISTKLCLSLGKFLEAHVLHEEALKVYALASAPELQKRQLLLLKKLGRVEEAMSFAQHLVSNGRSVAVRIYGNDYLAKHQRALASSTTRRIKEAAVVNVRYSPDHSIEAAVLDHLVQEGYTGFFSENYVWRSIFGLFHWEEIAGLEYNTIHHPLQRLPSDMYDGFLQKRQQAIEAKWQTVNTIGLLGEFLVEQMDKYLQMANPYVHWHPQLATSIQAYLQWLTHDQVKAVLMTIADNPKENGTGFPDLFVYKNDHYAFYEVKSPNDHLSPQQLYWINFFSSIGISVDILRTL